MNPVSTSSAAPPAASQAPTSKVTDPQPRPGAKKRKGHRGGKKKRSKRKSFAVLDDGGQSTLDTEDGDGFYQMPSRNLSGTSIDSEALLDHRAHQPMRPRRSSTLPTQSPFRNPFGPSYASGASRLRSTPQSHRQDEENPWNETAPLLAESNRAREAAAPRTGYGARDQRSRSRRPSSKSSRTRLGTAFSGPDSYDVNHPPSIPNSPTFGPAEHGDMTFGDVMIRDDFAMHSGTPHTSEENDMVSTSVGHMQQRDNDRRRPSAPDDVCLPGPGMSELGEEDFAAHDHETHHYRTRRRRGQWPDLSILEEWRQFEKEGRTDERRVKNITEPQLINGRLRPVRKGWYQTDEDAPYRFTYFNEEFESTIHSQTISELCQPGGGFQELFIPDPRVLSDDESESEDDMFPAHASRGQGTAFDQESRTSTRQTSLAEPRREKMGPVHAKESHNGGSSNTNSGRATPIGVKSPRTGASKTTTSAHQESSEKELKYGERPVWWLDVMCPTEAEMKVISKAFGIHPLTAEDIMLEEAREKVELFRHYYFVNYRTFDQDMNSENYLEPVNMYVVVFREGVLSFHFSMTPHPANVRRRIRQLRDYLILSSDWISYAIIDDITDVFQPLIQNIEDEVDEIDDSILQLHSSADKRLKAEQQTPTKNDDATTTLLDSSGDMLRRVGDCRKRVMSLYRLLGNKADVIKGFAKRCNERWEVAPRSEIGLYLGDIQDHIVTMTSNLTHYEKILARSHGNYLAQINIRMNERQEQTADVLGKLTVLGTIVLPMNIITGLWGMNVWVPGQEYEGNLTWFWCITAGLLVFGLGCYMIAKRVYKIV